MTPHFSEVVDGKTAEIYLESYCDVLSDIPHNGPGGFGAIVKGCFISEGPDPIEYCFNEIQGALIQSRPISGLKIEENKLDIGYKGYL